MNTERQVSDEIAPYTPDILLESLEAARINPSRQFANVYSEYDRDMAQVAALSELYNAPEVQQELSLGAVGEALVYDRLRSGIMGERISIRPASRYDDFKHGADIVAEAEGFRDPTVFTIDVTLNQADIKGKVYAPRFAAEENPRPVGLDEKLKRIRRHIDFVSDGMSAGDARDLAAWLHGGGMREKQTTANMRRFNMAERAMLLKYYESPDESDPNRFRSVMGGPQSVLSLDLSFVNKVFSDVQHQERHLASVDTIIQAEMGFSIAAFQQHLDRRVKQSTAQNLFFDMHYATTKAWSDLLNSGEQREIIERAIMSARGNRDLGGQLSYYMGAWGKAFS